MKILVNLIEKANDTMEEWEGERRTPPAYVVSLIEFRLKAYKNEKKE